ncbi:hypothetical protein GCK32_018351 [Trichostrongylus colubriformis]|uniref:ShKT domain-containing protein n=1 Tax=Trichostrongylus colubriformis TaxID=6319 RepID=A0AAN8F5P1_TRICO
MEKWSKDWNHFDQVFVCRFFRAARSFRGLSFSQFCEYHCVILTMRALLFALCLLILVYGTFQKSGASKKRCKDAETMKSVCNYVKSKGHCHAKNSLIAKSMKMYCAKTCALC